MPESDLGAEKMSLGYRPDIDGLRAVAVLSVMLFHFDHERFPGGFVGVDVFFVISGYLITAILLRELDAGTFSLMDFYERRARRILPALLLVLFACIPLAFATMLPAELEWHMVGTASVLGFASNFWLMVQGGYFRPSTELQPLLHTWSLAVEEQFYLFFPLLLMFLARHRRVNLGILLGVLALLSIVFAEWAWRAFPSASFFFSPGRAFELLAGSLVLLAGRQKMVGWLASPPQVLREVGAALGLGAILVAVFAFDASTPSPSFALLLPIIGAAVLIKFGNHPTYATRLLSCRPAVALGLISYSTYLWHQPLFAFARRTGELSPVVGASVLLGALVLGALSWYWVERPFRDRRTMPLPRLAATLGAGTAALVLSVGVTISANGFPNRYPVEDRSLALFDLGEAADYVKRRYKTLSGKPYAEDGRTRVLIVGDSFAKDLLNVLYERGLDSRLDLAVWELRPGCGNLIQAIDYSLYLDTREQAVCERTGRWSAPGIDGLASKADVIWLASAWRDWEAPLVATSVERLGEIYDAQVLVLGRKSVGPVNIPSLVAAGRSARDALEGQYATVDQEIDAIFEATLPQQVWIPFGAAFCGIDGSCPMFDSNDRLHSFDGVHLTPAGAIRAGDILFSNDRVGKALGLTDNVGRWE